MHLLRTASIALLLCTSSTLAFAADMDYPPLEPVTHNDTTPVEYGSGWYLRGDIGASKNKLDGVKYRQGSTSFTGNFETFDLDASWTYGAGIGYNLTDNIRIDATYKHHGSADFTGSSAQGELCDSGVGPELCDFSESSAVSVDTYMLNGYVDLGHFGRFTPYVGAGAGMASVQWSDLTNSEVCVSGGCTLAADVTHAGSTEKSFAYSLHTGVAFDISENMKMDLGYSFTQVDGGSMFDFETGNAMSGEQGRHGDLTIHAVQAGIRYSLW